MRYALILWLSCFSLFAQSPLSTGSGIGWTQPSSALTLSPVPTWRFSAKDNTNGIAVGGLVPTLTDSIQGAILKQLSSARQATNAGALGLGFASGPNFYTNFPGLSLGTTWTVIFLGMAGDSGWNIGQFCYWGTFVSSAGEITGQGAVSNGKTAYNYYSVGGTPTAMSLGIPITNRWSDVAFVMDSAGNAATLYTNGIAAVVAAKDASAWTLKSLGYDNSFAAFDGWWRELIIYQGTALTSAQITSAHNYLTNFYGTSNGFTP